MRRMALATLCCGALFATPAVSHDIDLKQKARELGVAIGNHYTCIAKDEKALARADSEAMYDMILFQFGHELAYVYAVAVGYGAGMDKSGFDCEKLTAHLAEVKGKMGLGRAQ